MPDSGAEAERWKKEAEFFDHEADSAQERLSPVHPLTIERYGTLKRRRFSKEFRFRVLGDLTGKNVLDVGCGDGENAMNFAKLGAQVTGLDISPRAIDLAKRRADVNHVSGLTTFICSPLETAQFALGSFDVIWGDAVLHHLIHDLDNVMTHLMEWLKPGGIIMFGEPVSLSSKLRQIRMMLPIKTDATPDERPLERGEFEIIARHVPDLEIRYYAILERFNRYVLVDENYELSAAWRRAIQNVLNAIDYAVLSIPPLQWLAGTAVMYGHKGGTSQTPATP